MTECVKVHAWAQPSRMGKADARAQHGLAIVTVLLVIALLVTLLGFLVEDQHLLIRRLTNETVAEQGFQYAAGVEEWAIRVLQNDADRAIDFDRDDWAEFGQPIEADDDEQELGSSLNQNENEVKRATIDFGLESITYEIQDLQGRFNLNNLSVSPPALEGQKTIFLNLLQNLGIEDTQLREALLGALIDWLDENDLISANGVESPDYQSGSTSYFAADQKLSTLGELKYVRGFNTETIDLLAPYVTVLPTSNAKININTTTTEVLAALSNSRATLDTNSVQSFLARRLDENFSGFTPDQVIDAQTAIIGSVPVNGGFVNDMLQTSSQYFQINTRVELGDSMYCSYTIVFRPIPGPESASDGRIKLLNRHYSRHCEQIVP